MTRDPDSLPGHRLLIKNRRHWFVVVPLTTHVVPAPRFGGYYLDFANNLIFQSLSGKRTRLPRPYHVVKPGPHGWDVEHMEPVRD